MVMDDGTKTVNRASDLNANVSETIGVTARWVRSGKGVA